MDLKPWQCGVCKFKTMLRPEIVDHCSRAHGFKFQFRCAFCPYSGSVHMSVLRHQGERHDGRTASDVLHVYYKERSLPADDEDNPLWTKQRLLLNSGGDNIKAEVGESSKASGGATRAASSAPAQSAPPPPIDLAIVKSEVEEEPPKGATDAEESAERYGEIGDPRGELYLCPLCKNTAEESRLAFITHLHEELNCRRWGCNTCSYRAFSKLSMMQHNLHEHKLTQEPSELPRDTGVELWIERLLEHQDAMIASNKAAKRDVRPPPTSKDAPTSLLQLNEGPSSDVVQQMQTLFGDFGAPSGDCFACPKCEFKTTDESKMTEHLEMELAKVRWACSRCSQKFQHYHEAQRHCSTVHPTFAYVSAVSKDPAQRTLWIECVVRAQSRPPRAPTAELVAPDDGVPSTSAESTDNSLLVVRYEEDVPGPSDGREPPASRKRKTTSVRDDDSDEEPRLVIADRNMTHTCHYCPHRTTNVAALRGHMLRHFNMRPYNCGYCDFTGYKGSVDNHLKKVHPDLPPKWIANKLPTTAAPAPGPLPMPRNTKFYRGQKKDAARAASAAATSAKTAPPAATSAKTAPPATTATAAPPAPAAAPAPSEETSYVCLLCDQELTAVTATGHHDAAHRGQPQQIVVRGALVRRCGSCPASRADADMLQRHHASAHSGDEFTYKMVRAGHEPREALVCDHCGRTFSYLRDLRCHHSAAHASLQLQYSKKGAAKRKQEDEPRASAAKRVAKKSTAKLPFVLKAVARKSTTRLPTSAPTIDISSDDEEEYSYYGTKPIPVERMGHVQTSMPFYGTMMPISVEKLSGLINVSPLVSVADFKRPQTEGAAARSEK